MKSTITKALVFLLCVTLLTSFCHTFASAAQPLGLTFSVPKAGSNKLSLSWNSISKADYYLYSVRDIDTDELIKDRVKTTKTSVSFTATWVAGHSYRVWVGACCPGNDPNNTNTWDYTEMTVFTVLYPTIEKLSNPGGLSVKVSGTSMTASWNKVSGASYYAYSLRDLNTNELLAYHIETSGRSVKVSNLTKGHDYRLAICAVPEGADATSSYCGWTEYTFTVPASTATPTATPRLQEKLSGPSGLSVSVNGTTMSASWNKVSGASYYTYSLRDLTTDTLLAYHVQTNGRSVTVNGLTRGHDYRIAICAVPSGEDPSSDYCGWTEYAFTGPAPTATPRQQEKLSGPSGLSVAVSGTNMNASWNAVSGASYYTYSLRDLTTDALLAYHVETSGRSVKVNGLTRGHDYRLAICAVPKGADTSSAYCGWTEYVFTVPAPTATLTATPRIQEKLSGPSGLSVNVSGTSMTASWNAVSGASGYAYSLRNLTNDALISYHVEANSRSIRVSNLTEGNSYRLAICAIPRGLDSFSDYCGWTEYVFNVPVSVIPAPRPQEKLAGPGGLSISVSGATMTATWNKVAGASGYTYSLRDLTTNELLAFHIQANSRTIHIDNLTEGHDYRLAVCAVPEGVDATSDLCGWTEHVFFMPYAIEDTTSEQLPESEVPHEEARGSVDIQSLQALPNALQQTSKEYSDIAYGTSDVGTAACGLFALLNIVQYDQGVVYDRESVEMLVSEMKGTTNKDGLQVAMDLDEIPVQFGEGKTSKFYANNTVNYANTTGYSGSNERKGIIEDAVVWLQTEGNYLVLSTPNKNLRGASTKAANTPHFIAVVGLTADGDFLIMDSTASYQQAYYYSQILDAAGMPTGYGVLTKEQVIDWGEVAINYVSITN